jgi:8-oxo-dGTP diphosphatase
VSLRTERQRIAAYGLARSDSSILLVRATETIDGHHTWWLPGGGVRFGESPQECIVREFAEETGLHVHEARLLDVLSDVSPLVSESVLLHSVRLIYDVTLEPGHLVKEGAGSTDEVGWFDERGLPEVSLVSWLSSYLTTR